MAGNSVAKIGVGSPLATGGVLVGSGLTLPVGVSSSTSTFTKLGLVDENGVVPGGTRTTTKIIDWAGDVIANPQDEHSSAFTFALYQAWDADVLKVAFGAAQVSTVGSLTTVVENGEPLDQLQWVFEMRDKGAKRVRIAVPNAETSTVEEGPFIRNKLQMFKVTINCLKDDDGNKVYRYYDDGSVASAPTITSHSPSGTFATAGGQIIVLTGTDFTGTTNVTFGGTAALDFEVISDQMLSVITPAKAAGSVNVVVTNATGASAPHAITYA